MKFRTLFLSLALTAPALAAAPAPPIDQQFEQTVRPFVGKYCVACHSGKMAPAQFDLKSYTNVDMVADDLPRWALLRAPQEPGNAAQAHAGPARAEARQQVIDWVAASAPAEAQESRRRPRSGDGPPPQQRRVQLHHPRPYRPGPQRRQASSRWIPPTRKASTIPANP